MNAAIRPARPEEAERLTSVACRSKAHWGYSAEEIDYWRTKFLTVTADYIMSHAVWVAADERDEAVAFAALERYEDGAVLEHLWVLPQYMRAGIGRRLFLQVAASASEFTFTSDPNADEFYLKLGAEKIGDLASVYQKRFLSEFRFRVSD